MEERIIGKVMAVSGDKVELAVHTFAPENEKITCLFSELPAAAATAKEGDWFEAKIISSESERVIKWLTWDFRPPLREDEGAWDEFDEACRQCATRSSQAREEGK